GAAPSICLLTGLRSHRRRPRWVRTPTRCCVRFSAALTTSCTRGETQVSSADDVKRQARARFGAAADRYVRDRIHVEGDELGRLIELARLTCGQRVLDVATGGGPTALPVEPPARRGA